MKAKKHKVTSKHYIKEKSKYTRVTVPLHMFSMPFLALWELRIGKKAARKISKTSSNFGNKVHTMCAKLAQGKRVKVTKDCKPMARRFRKWFKENVDKVLFIEQPFFDDKDMVAGTPDLVCVLKSGKIAVVDYKTGRIYPYAKLQIGEYVNLVDSVLHRGINAYEGYIFPLGKKTCTAKKSLDLIRLKPIELSCALRVYKCVLYTYRWLQGEKTNDKKRKR